jgi:hypothetical protein
MKAHLLLFLFVAAFLCGCEKQRAATVETVAGEYIYRYQSGEVEVLQLDSNLSYRQSLYSRDADYKGAGGPVHTNSNSWSLNGRSITLNGWLSFCKYPNPNERLKVPMPFASMTGNWIPPSGQHDAALLLSQSGVGYALMRVYRPQE